MVAELSPIRVIQEQNLTISEVTLLRIHPLILINAISRRYILLLQVIVVGWKTRGITDFVDMAWKMKHVCCRYRGCGHVVKWIEKQPLLQTPASVTLLIDRFSERESIQIE